MTTPPVPLPPSASPSSPRNQVQESLRRFAEWGRGNFGRAGLIAAAAAVLLFVTTVVASALWAWNYSNAGEWEAMYFEVAAERDAVQKELEGVSNKADALEASRASMQDKVRSLEGDATTVADRATELDTREADVKRREDAMAAKEADLSTREGALSAANSGWWAPKVQECLGRGGGFISATVTTSSWGGNDFSCYTG